MPQKRLLWTVFFQNFGCGAENLTKTGTKQCLGRAGKINSVDLKKDRQNFRNFFLNPPSPRENPRSAPGTQQKKSSRIMKISQDFETFILKSTFLNMKLNFFLVQKLGDFYPSATMMSWVINTVL